MAFFLTVQLLVLLFCSLSIGAAVRRFFFPGSDGSPRVFLLSFFTGFALQILMLQNLVYAGLPVGWTFWLCPALGVAAYIITRRDLASEWGNSLTLRREGVLMIAILTIVFVAQSVSAIMAGHDNYYGFARIDHFNYTITSEYLRHSPFGGSGQDPQDTVWLLKVNQTREQRLGQSILQAYLGSISFTTTKDAYAGAVAFCIGLLAVGAYGLSRSFSISRPFSLATACWVGLCPGSTFMHLEGFMSQSCSAMIFPWLMLLPRWAGQARFPIVLSAIPLTLLLVTYTELFPIGVAVFGLASVARHGISIRSIGKVLATVALAAVLVPAYLPRAVSFMAMQYTVASAKVPQLESLAPDGGTIFGWVSVLASVPFVPPALQHRILVLLGVILLVSCAAGIFAASPRKRLYLGAVTLGVGLFLCILLSNPDFARYPFQKIVVSFGFLWIVLSVAGISRTAMWLRQSAPPSARRAFLYVLLVIMSVLVGSGYGNGHLAVIKEQGVLTMLSEPSLRDTFRMLSADRAPTYVIRESNGLIGAWLAYHAYHSKTFYTVASFSDLIIPPGVFRFSTVPHDPDLSLVSRQGIRNSSTRLERPDIVVANPQGQDAQGSSIWYWLGDSVTIEIGRWDGSKAPKHFVLSFQAEPGPAHPSLNRVINLIGSRDSTLTRLEIAGPRTLSASVLVNPGLNEFRLESVTPIEHLVKLPGDNRKHLTKLSNFSLAEAAPGAISSSLPSPTASAGHSISVVNSQGVDGAGSNIWYWVGKEIKILVDAPTTGEDTSFRLKLRAEAGPAAATPARKLRLTDRDGKVNLNYSFNGVSQIEAVLQMHPGSNEYTLSVVEPTEQTVKLPGDPRNLMVRVSGISLIPMRSMPALKGDSK